MATWEIYKPSGECAETGTKIDFGDEYFGALVDGEEGLAPMIAKIANEGDMVVCLGAGTITGWANALPDQLTRLRYASKEAGE